MNTLPPTPDRVPAIAALHRPLRVLLWCALVAGIAITALGVRRVDLWWQLPEGLAILHDGRLPIAPPAAFGLPHRPYVDEYSLYEIALALLDRLGGLDAVRVAFTGVYLLIFAVPLAAARGMRRDGLALACLALAGIFLVNRYEERPELAGALLLALLLNLLRRTRDFSPGLLLRVALLLAIWTNVHSSYVVGLLAVFLWVIERVFLAPGPRWSLRHGALALGTAAAAVLVNPYGWERVAFTFAQERDLGSNLLSREMWPAWDQSALTQGLLVVAAVLMAVACLSRRRPAPWLAAFSCAMLVFGTENIRHISFLAVALLYIYATRPEAASSEPYRGPARTLLFGGACVCALLFDLTALRLMVHRSAADPAGNERSFAPALVERLRQRGPAAVICHDAEGSYLTFAGAGLLHPLLDSGQGRFDDATKRFYFFLEQEPRAFDLALDRLDVDDVLVTRPMAAWVAALANRPGWHLAAWSDSGLLFARGPVPAMLNGAGRDQLRALHDTAQRIRDPLWAFCFSTLADDPEISLALLDRSRVSDWSEPFLAFFRPWLDRVPAEAIETFLQHNPGPGDPILRELVLTRLGSHAPLAPVGPQPLEKMARVLDLLQRGDTPGARALFATLPRPPASALYYDLSDRLDPAASKRDGAAQKWQNWNAGGPELFQRLSAPLNRRISSFGDGPAGNP